MLIVIFRGQNPLHILGQYGRENGAAIFELFIEAMPQYPLNKPDMEGNTGDVYSFAFSAFYVLRSYKL